MKAFFDTSVLVAEPSFELFAAQSVTLQRRNACTAAHCLAEVHSTLTGMPGKDRASGDEALLFLGNIRERLTIVTLDPVEYFAAVEDAAALGVTGGGIYDALLASCALKAKAQSIYTWNVNQFRRLGPDIAARIKTP